MERTKKNKIRIDEESCITRTLDMLSKYQHAFYTDLILSGHPNTRRHIHKNMEPNDYRISFRGHKEHSLGGYQPLEHDDGRRFKIISVTEDGGYMFSLMGDAFEENYARIKDEPGTKLNKALITRCAIAAQLMGADIGPVNSLSEIRAKTLPRFFPAIMFKRDVIERERDEKYKFSRMRGVYETRFGKPLPMFPSRGSELIIFKGTAEEKMRDHISRMFPAYGGEIDSCIIVSDTIGCAVNTVKTALKKRAPVPPGLSEATKEALSSPRLTEVYRHIHFATMTEEGINTLRFYEADPSGAAIIRALLPDADMYGTTTSIFEYDGKKGDEYYIQFLTGNIGRLVRMISILRNDVLNFRIYCMPEQAKIVNECFKDEVRKPVIELITKPEELMHDLNIDYGLGLKYFRTPNKKY